MSSSTASKPECSYGAACYRRNGEHFRTMAHRHLDALLDKMPEDKPIELPEKLDFPCTSRALLREQLVAALAARKNGSAGGETSRPNVQGKSDEGVQIRKMRREQVLLMMKQCGEEQKYVPPQGEFAQKYRDAGPYRIFFAAVQKSRPTWSQKNSVTLSELLDKSLGKIILSLHLNFVVDLGWLCTQYLLAEQSAEMVIFYGDRGDESPVPATIKMHKVTCPNAFGCHHSKLSILQYEDKGIRVIVSTANLYKDDWNLRTQGIWMSQHLPRLPLTARATDGESKTGFKQELIRYLSVYGREMEQWKATVTRTDFSSVDVALVCSVPGYHPVDSASDKWGYARLASVLAKHVEIPKDEQPTTIIGQASSIGNLGPGYSSWLGSQLANSMARTTANALEREQNYEFKAIYPTIENYKSSYDMREAANCLCYSEERHTKQLWFQKFLHKWSAERIDRSRAVPHIKTFARISKDARKMWWFVLGSANLSKAAWGYRQGRKHCVLNYEASVVFLPKFVTGSTSFPLQQTSGNTTPLFPLAYDLPLKRYERGDRPFVSEFFQKGDNIFQNLDFEDEPNEPE